MRTIGVIIALALVFGFVALADVADVSPMGQAKAAEVCGDGDVNGCAETCVPVTGRPCF
jgi:hypothetical protein